MDLHCTPLVTFGRNVRYTLKIESEKNQLNQFLSDEQIDLNTWHDYYGGLSISESNR